MKFEATESMRTGDIASVLNLLETNLRPRCKEIERRGSTLTVRRIEQGWGRYRNDVTTIECRTNGQVVLVVASTNYRPSIWFWTWTIFAAFRFGIGWIVPPRMYFYQKKTVKGALAQTLQRVKNESEMCPWTAPFPSTSASSSAPPTQEVPLPGDGAVVNYTPNIRLRLSTR
jgi:hypothetical protein